MFQSRRVSPVQTAREKSAMMGGCSDRNKREEHRYDDRFYAWNHLSNLLKYLFEH